MNRRLQKLNTVLHMKSVLFRPKTAAVILAGGSGTRLGSAEPKQFLTIAGHTVLAHAVRAFDASRFIDEIVIVSPELYIDRVRAIVKKEGFRKVRAVVAGGDTRQKSAEAGLLAVSDKMKYIAIHDAARCLVTGEMIADTARAAYAYKAAIAASPASDSVKRVNRYGMIEENIPRESVYLAETPQIFHRVYYTAAVSEAKKKRVSVTDDASLMELIGQRVKVVESSQENFKITFPGDLTRAENILSERKCRK